MNYRDLKVFDVSPPDYRFFSRNVCKLLRIKPGEISVGQFKDGATDVDIGDNVRGCDVYVFQSRVRPIAERLDELYNFIDGTKYGGHAARVTAVLPYCFGQRGERRTKARQPVPTIVMARNLKSNGCDKIVTVTAHTTAIGSIFNALNLDFEHLEAEYLHANYVIHNIEPPIAIGAPDVGGINRSRRIRNIVLNNTNLTEEDVKLVAADKYRPKSDIAELWSIIGDVKGRNVYEIDDVGDTLGTSKNAGKAYMEAGANFVDLGLTHMTLGEGHEKNLAEMLSKNSPFRKIIMGNTVPIPTELAAHEKTYILPLETFVAEAIRRMHEDASISGLHDYKTILEAYENRQLEGVGNLVKIKK